ncbi:MAG: class I SAM-dependent methyltransferase [Spirochaetia bacterium]|nr:class I SAM-dependent methyltransferase [Spirochaetia bacterium]
MIKNIKKRNKNKSGRIDPEPAKSEWDSVSSWYNQLVGESGSDFHRSIVIPGVFRLLEPEIGQHILDAGCGQGVFARALSQKKIHVTGVDLSSKLIQSAKKQPGYHPEFESYIVASTSSMNDLKNASFDGAVCILSLQDMENLHDAASEITRCIRTGGKLVWVIMHPCFRIPRQSHWEFDEVKKIQYRRLDRYLSPMKIPIQTRPGKNPDLKTSSYHRPLHEYINVLAENGWYIQKMEEWISDKKSSPGPRAKAENRARNEFPLFMAIQAVKLKS